MRIANAMPTVFIVHCRPKDYYAAAKRNNKDRKIMQIPLFLGAIAIFYVSSAVKSPPYAVCLHCRHLIHLSARQNNNNGKVASLKLDGCVLVEIFSGQIKTWNHPKIKALNGDNVPDGKIVVVHRMHGSSSTSGTTQYLRQVAIDLDCPKKWPEKMNGGANVGSKVGTNGVWFSDGSDVAAQGSSGVLAKLRCLTGLVGLRG